jgi:DNA end-binding protein Ku
VPNLPEHARVAPEQLKAAKQLIDQMSITWTPQDYRDTYEDRVRELIDAKRAGQEIVTAEAAPEATNVIDLMDALRRSLDRTSGTPQVGVDASGGKKGSGSQRGHAQRPKATATKHRSPKEDLAALSKTELYERATQLSVAGRSKMTREQLQAAVTKAARPKAVA